MPRPSVLPRPPHADVGSKSLPPKKPFQTRKKWANSPFFALSSACRHKIQEISIFFYTLIVKIFFNCNGVTIRAAWWNPPIFYVLETFFTTMTESTNKNLPLDCYLKSLYSSTMSNSQLFNLQFRQDGGLDHVSGTDHDTVE